jgi:hypothetical protein
MKNRHKFGTPLNRLRSVNIRAEKPEQLRELGELQIIDGLGVGDPGAVVNLTPVTAGAVDKVDIPVDHGLVKRIGQEPFDVVSGRAGEGQAAILKAILEPGLEHASTVVTQVYPHFSLPTAENARAAPTINVIRVENVRLASRQDELARVVFIKENLELELSILLHELTHNLILKHMGHGKDARDLLTDIRVRHHGRGRGLVLGHGHVFVVSGKTMALY